MRASVCVCAGAYITVGIDDDERNKGESTSGREEGRKEGEKSELYVKKKEERNAIDFEFSPLFLASVCICQCACVRALKTRIDWNEIKKEAKKKEERREPYRGEKKETNDIN